MKRNNRWGKNILQVMWKSKLYENQFGRRSVATIRPIPIIYFDLILHNTGF